MNWMKSNFIDGLRGFFGEPPAPAPDPLPPSERRRMLRVIRQRLMKLGVIPTQPGGRPDDE